MPRLWDVPGFTARLGGISPDGKHLLIGAREGVRPLVIFHSDRWEKSYTAVRNLTSSKLEHWWKNEALLAVDLKGRVLTRSPNFMLKGKWVTTLRARDVVTGKLIYSKEIMPFGKFAHRGSVIAFMGVERMTILDVATGRLLSRHICADPKPWTEWHIAPSGTRHVTQMGKKVALWDTRTGRRIGSLPYYKVLSFSRDATRLLITLWSGQIAVYDANTAKRIQILKLLKNPSLSRDGKLIAGINNRGAIVHSVGSRVAPFTVPKAEAATFAGPRVLISRRGNTLQVWENTAAGWMRKLKLSPIFRPPHCEDCSWFSVHPKLKLLFVRVARRQAELWSLDSYKLVRRLREQPMLPAWWFPAYPFHIYGRWLVADGEGATTRFIDRRTGRRIRRSLGRLAGVTAVTFSPDGDHLAVGTTGGSIVRWPLAKKGQPRSDRVHRSRVHRLAYDPKGNWIVSVSEESEVQIRDVNSWKLLRSQPRSNRDSPFRRDGVVDLLLDAKGRHFVTKARLTGFLIRDARTGKRWKMPPGIHTSPLRAAASPNLKVFAVTQIAPGGYKGQQGLRLRTAGSKKWTLAAFAGRNCIRPIAVTFSPDSRYMAAANIAGDTVKCTPGVRLYEWHLDSYTTLSVKHRQEVTALAFSRDGRYLASGSADSTVQLFSTDPPRSLRFIRGHRTLVMSVAFSPDGKLLASGSADGTVKLWRVTNGELLATMVTGAAKDDPAWLVFTPDGRVDGPDAARTLLRWRAGKKLVDGAQLWKQRRRPGLLQQVVQAARASGSAATPVIR